MAGISHHIAACATDRGGETEIIRKGYRISIGDTHTEAAEKQARGSRLSETQSPHIHPTSSESVGRLFKHTAARRRRCARGTIQRINTVYGAALVLLLVCFSLQFLVFLDRGESIRGVVVAETVQVDCLAVYGVTAAGAVATGR